MFDFDRDTFPMTTTEQRCGECGKPGELIEPPPVATRWIHADREDGRHHGFVFVPPAAGAADKACGIRHVTAPQRIACELEGGNHSSVPVEPAGEFRDDEQEFMDWLCNGRDDPAQIAFADRVVPNSPTKRQLVAMAYFAALTSERTRTRERIGELRAEVGHKAPHSPVARAVLAILADWQREIEESR